MEFTHNGHQVFVMEMEPDLFGLPAGQAKTKRMMWLNRLHYTIKSLDKFMDTNKMNYDKIGFQLHSSVEETDNGHEEIPAGMRYIFKL